MPTTSVHLSKFSESTIGKMTRIAEKYGAISLSSGFPDFDPPPELLAAAEVALHSGFNQYANIWGAQRFLQALARKQSHFMGLDIDPDAHTTVTCGSTEAMMVAMLTICNPGDKVILFSPFYENYAVDIILSGAQPIFVPLEPPDFQIDPEALQRTFQQGIKGLILCNPSNPSGKVFTVDELRIIAGLAQEYDTFVITDEVYEHIIYPPHQHTYIASLPGMHTRTISCSSLSKTYAITGWRLGYVIAAPEITNAIRKVHNYFTLGAPAPLQEAAVTALNFPDIYYRQLQADYTHRRKIFLDYLDQIGLQYIQPQGAYYVLVDISPFNFSTDNEFCIWMAKEIGVTAVPGSSFFNEPIHHLIRFNFAKRFDTLKEVGRRLLKLKAWL